MPIKDIVENRESLAPMISNETASFADEVLNAKFNGVRWDELLGLYDVHP